MSGYSELPPPASLDPFVECFWTSQPSSAARRVLPDGCIDIVFSHNGGLQLVGTMTRPLLVVSANQAFAGVRFRPGMARPFIGAATAEVADQLLQLEQIWGIRARGLEEQLRNSSGLQPILTALAAELKPPSHVSPVQRAIAALAQNSGSISLQEISRQAGLSERQLRRRCLAETGITPKQLARIARFRRACSSIHSTTHWANLALECGYYDQSHLIHEFHEFSGHTPGLHTA